MAKKSSQFVDYDDSDFEDENETDLEDNDQFHTSSVHGQDAVATWRKIEDFWDNHDLNKRINDDPYSDKYFDYLLDGELN